MSLCTYDNCYKRASFNYENNKALFCYTHKLDSMINVTINKCIHPNCKTTANYNTINNKRGIYCVSHKTPDMISVTSIKCKYIGCLHVPSFNNIGEKRGIYCDEHKLQNMINVTMKRCLSNGCAVYPTFNFPNIKSPIYCSSHKLNTMVNVVDSKCIESGCTTRPIYNYSTEKVAKYCKIHKLQGMIDIKSKYCIFTGCKTRPIYNSPKESTGIYCCAHKLVGMINIKDKKCREPECSLIPSFNQPGERRGVYCAKHRKLDMVNVIEKKCKTPLCDTQVKEKYDGYCLRCFIYQFPDKPVSRNYKTKEKSVLDYLRGTFKNYKLISDKKIIGGDSYRRPDIMLELPSHCIIIEIDENQHKLYDCSCENKRIMQLSSDIKFKTLIFIRFNPDKYFDISGTLIESCWSVDGNGISRIKNVTEWDNRLLALKTQIQYWIDNLPDKMLEIVQLYYDQK